jgi:hypothetical protein
MKTTKIVTLMAGAILALTSISAFADDSAVQQDKQAVQATKSEIKADRQKVAADKASGNSTQLVQDKAALKAAKQKKHQQKQRHEHRSSTSSSAISLSKLLPR